ncbi:nitric oxide synthase, inducible [Pelobates cultripes]|uniref:Nitric oxide synthase n=2 Tax=Pelobates cultripes TaxID=61616 RepID=A0AAD1VKR1_PELCU|nr:nitric oxide synthase, inducible [Pelobates cultripes]
MMCPWKLFTKSSVINGKTSYDVMDINNNNNLTMGITQSSCKHEEVKNNLKQNDIIGLKSETVDTPENLKLLHKNISCPKYLKLKNYENGKILQDTLHLNAKKNLSCQSKVCHGSIMNPKNYIRGPREERVPADVVLPQAIEFINQYYNSFKDPQIENHLNRLEIVVKEIDRTGTYQLTYDELVFAAKQAWRNAPRCIGRIQWSNLQVFDARNCKTAKEMFDLICRHIKYATNGGNIRSAITVFPQRTDGKHDFRMWNSQLIRYAGFEMEDGSVLGDPASTDFTKLCIHLGWKPKYERFEILPLVLQADGQDPEMFEIPSELILEVVMEHPRYDWFKELNLKWYTLPAVANMLLEVGGVEFPACPFNGWYMGTEIGVRDFCDISRYNVLQDIGKRMGLDTSKVTSLWKDLAVVEINVAVLYSFQKQNVTITDHHTAAESFIKHMENEHRLRGGCPADWVWLVPPMSGSVTTVFHQEMLNYILSPFYYYQIDPWKTHVWHDESLKPKKNTFKFSTIAKSLLFASILLRKSMASRTKATIIYATETGKSETFAKKLHTLFSYAFNSKVLCMDEYDISNLEKETLLLIVTSTFGNGDCPGNGETFKKSISAMSKLKNKLRFAVFGLGSSMYPHFCAFAHTMEEKLANLGALQIGSTGEGDELNGQDEAFHSWAAHTFKAACEVFKIRDRESIVLPKCYTSTETWNPENYRLVKETQSLNYIKALTTMHSRNILPMRLKHRENLCQNSSRATLLVKLSCENSQEVQYLPGEHVGVYPGNHPNLVTGIIKLLKDAPPCNQDIRLETRSEQGNFWTISEKIPSCSLFQMLTYFLDLTTPPTQLLLKKLSLLAADVTDKTRLEELCNSTDKYNEWKSYYYPTFLEVLKMFPSLEVHPTFLITQLPSLKPRYYSVSSSTDVTPGEIHLTVGVVNYKTQDGSGPLHEGVCSTWLNTININDIVPCFVRSSNAFHLPENSSSPCVLIGTGTGIAPYRGFWQQRTYDIEKKGKKAGSMILVSGCRQLGLDEVYKEETLYLKSKGILKEVYTAYSREPGLAKTYVQDILKQNLEQEICKIVLEEQGHLYVCGNIQMARDVTATLKTMIANKKGLNEEEIDLFFSQLKSEMRYHEDIFGATYKPSQPKNGFQPLTF